MARLSHTQPAADESEALVKRLEKQRLPDTRTAADETAPAPPGPARQGVAEAGAARAPYTPQSIDISALRAGRAPGGSRSAITGEIESACTGAGLFVAAGHGMDEQLDRAFAAARDFFSLPAAVKDRVPRINRYGYVPDRIEARNPAGAAHTGRSRHTGRSSLEPANDEARSSDTGRSQPGTPLDAGRSHDEASPGLGPSNQAGRSSLAAEYLDMGLGDEVDLGAVEALGCDGFASAVRAYQDAALATAHAVLEALAATLGVAGFFAARMSEPQCRLRFLHYPPAGRAGGDAAPMSGTPDRGDARGVVDTGSGAAPIYSTPHTDYGLITLLASDGVPGLEVLRDGAWTPVAVPRGSVIVQLGDMLARWTNDRYRSTPHRVVASSGADRFSIPFFVNPDPSTVVSTISSCVTAQRPARYEPVTAGEFLTSRIDSPDEPYI